MSDKKNTFSYEEMMKQFDPVQMTRQFQDLIANSPFANVDTSGLMESQRKTLESIQKANQSALAGAQSLMQKQSEMMQQAWTDASRAMQDLSKVEPSDAASENAAALEAAVKKSMDNFGEIAEMIQGIYSEISQQVETRMDESLKEFKDNLEKTKK